MDEERRMQTFRRQVNESFLDPHGNVAITKVMATASQAALLFHSGIYFDKLIDRPEVMAIIFSFLIVPDVAKKIISMKANGHGSEK